MTTKRMPTPYYVAGNLIVTADGNTIAQVNEFDNAKFIVNACNEYDYLIECRKKSDELFDALELVRKYMPVGKEIYDSAIQADVDFINKTLENAKVKS